MRWPSGGCSRRCSACCGPRDWRGSARWPSIRPASRRTRRASACCARPTWNAKWRNGSSNWTRIPIAPRARAWARSKSSGCANSCSGCARAAKHGSPRPIPRPASCALTTAGFNWATAEIAVNQDHFIVTERVTQSKADNHALVPLVDAVTEACAQAPGCVLADAGFSSQANLEAMEARGIDAYIPDSNLSSEMKGNVSADQRCPTRKPQFLAMRHKLRTPEGRRRYRERQGIVEPVFAILKEHRGMRKFQRRGLTKVAVEFTLAALAYNLTRFHRLRQTR